MTLLEDFAQAVVAPANADADLLIAALPSVLLDIAGSWIAGSATAEARDLAPGTLAPLGDGLLDRVARAVATTRLTETDDIHLASCTTAGAVVVPTALVLAPALGVDAPERVARAVAAGYDTMVRFAEAVHGPEILYRGLWPTYLAAPLGAAAVTAALLGLDAGRSAHALAIALAQVSGAPGRGEAGLNPRWLLAGLAARNGVAAAFAAHRGFCGDLALLDGDWLARTHGIDFDPAPMRGAIAGTAMAEISRKRFCAARQTIASIEAFTTLLANGVAVEDVRAVEVAVPTVYAQMISQAPAHRMGRIAGVAWLLALAAFRPDDLYDLERPAIDDPRFAEFVGKVSVIADPDLDALYPERWPARVRIVRHDGTALSHLVDAAYGDPTRPLSDADLLAKFLRLAGPVVGARAAATIADSCRLAGSSPAALGELCATLSRLGT